MPSLSSGSTCPTSLPKCVCLHHLHVGKLSSLVLLRRFCPGWHWIRSWMRFDVPRQPVLGTRCSFALASQQQKPTFNRFCPRLRALGARENGFTRMTRMTWGNDNTGFAGLFTRCLTRAVKLGAPDLHIRIPLWGVMSSVTRRVRQLDVMKSLQGSE